MSSRDCSIRPELASPALPALALCAALILTGCGREAEPASNETDTVADPSSARAVVASQTVTVQPGEAVTVLLELTTPTGWHTYWENPGETGMAPAFAWNLPAGLTEPRIHMPVPAIFTEDDIRSYGYEGTVGLLATFETDDALEPGAYDWRADLLWMICKETCMPIQSTVSGTIHVEAGVTDSVGTPGPGADLWRSRLPISTGAWAVEATLADDAIILHVEPSGEDSPSTDEWQRLNVLSLTNGSVLSRTGDWTQSGNTWTTRLKADFPVLTVGDHFEAVLTTGVPGDWRGWLISTPIQ